ncbi:MAG: carboxypeptidase-like regulatory domain-containing protein, partial [bacterium]|nr:carboxypeptidase-like regulatory domain-containing protein [bacterium]
KNYAIVGGAIVLAIVVAFWVVNTRVAKAPEAPVTVATTTTTVSTTTTTTTTTGGGGGKACTMEAKLCSDGSYVSRTGPNCEFTPCPTTIAPYNSGVRGTVLLGPTCPVERIPPDPQCADKGYETTITVRHTGSSATFATGKSDATGAFEFSLPPGSYTLTASGGTMLPRCNPIDVTVAASGYVTADISCDTGIR